VHFPPAASLLPIANSLARSSLQKAELDGDIARLQNNLRTGQLELSPEKLRTESVTVDRDSVRLAGSPAILENLASRGTSKSSPEVLSFVREWRAGVVKRENWRVILRRS
jgi:hypothetical protein